MNASPANIESICTAPLRRLKKAVHREGGNISARACFSIASNAEYEVTLVKVMKPRLKYRTSLSPKEKSDLALVTSLRVVGNNEYSVSKMYSILWATVERPLRLSTCINLAMADHHLPLVDAPDGGLIFRIISCFGDAPVRLGSMELLLFKSMIETISELAACAVDKPATHCAISPDTHSLRLSI
jgi:hypothetical protein